MDLRPENMAVCCDGTTVGLKKIFMVVLLYSMMLTKVNGQSSEISINLSFATTDTATQSMTSNSAKSGESSVLTISGVVQNVTTSTARPGELTTLPTASFAVTAVLPTSGTLQQVTTSSASPSQLTTLPTASSAETAVLTTSSILEEVTTSSASPSQLTTLPTASSAVTAVLPTSGTLQQVTTSTARPSELTTLPTASSAVTAVLPTSGTLQQVTTSSASPSKLTTLPTASSAVTEVLTTSSILEEVTTSSASPGQLTALPTASSAVTAVLTTSGILEEVTTSSASPSQLTTLLTASSAVTEVLTTSSILEEVTTSSASPSQHTKLPTAWSAVTAVLTTPGILQVTTSTASPSEYTSLPTASSTKSAGLSISSFAKEVTTSTVVHKTLTTSGVVKQDMTSTLGTLESTALHSLSSGISASVSRSSTVNEAVTSTISLPVSIALPTASSAVPVIVTASGITEKAVTSTVSLTTKTLLSATPVFVVTSSINPQSMYIGPSTSINVVTKKPTLAPDIKLEISCLMKFNVTFKESYTIKNSNDFRQLDEMVVPFLASVYETHLRPFNYYAVKTIGFSDARRLGTQIAFAVSFRSGSSNKEKIKGHLLDVSVTHLEGKIFKASPKSIQFAKNSFEFSEKVKVEPKKEETILVEAEFKIMLTYDKNLSDSESQEYKKLKVEVEQVLNMTFQDLPGFIKAIVNSFKNGSIVVDFNLIFDSSKAGTDTKEISNNVEQTYKKSTTDFLLGNFTVEELKVIKVQSQARSQTSTSSRSFATWAIVLVVCGVLIGILLMILVSQCRRTRRYKDIVEEVYSGAIQNGYGKPFYEMQDIPNGVGSGTPELKRLKKTSKYLGTFEGIPRAKLAETNLYEGVAMPEDQKEGIVNKSFTVSIEEEKSDVLANPAYASKKDMDLEKETTAMNRQSDESSESKAVNKEQTTEITKRNELSKENKDPSTEL